MKSPLDITVSCFPSYYDAARTSPVNLLTWLTSDKHKAKVDTIRQIRDKAERDALKATLPAITPSGLFTHRAEDALIQHSGLIQFDIDFAGSNKSIPNYESLISELCHISNVAYCGLSVSGMGYWGLIPILYPQQHKRHFEALKDSFLAHGIELDEKPKNIASLRGYSYDENAYFNHHAIPFKALSVLPPAFIRKNTRLAPHTSTGQRIKWAVDNIEGRGERFTEGNRHSYILKLCSLLVNYGISQSEAEAYIATHLIALSDIKSNCITDPYSRYKKDFGKWI